MDELKNMIKEFFEHNSEFYSKEGLQKKLKIKGEKQTNIFNEALKLLVEDGSLFFDTKKGYKLFSREIGVAFGEIEINKAGNGFVHTNDGYKIFINCSDLNGALDGDKVIVKSIDFGRKNDFKGEIDKVVKRKSGDIVCEVIGSGYCASIIPHNPIQTVNFLINKNELKDLVDGQIIIVNVGTKIIDGDYEASIKSYVGNKDEPNIDIKLLALKYNVPIEFSSEALEEIKDIPKSVSFNDCEDRIDLRDKRIVTIDCDDTKDRDDAVYVEKLDNGNYKLIVSIADVNHYIKRGSKLFDEALVRCTSHYPNNTCIPMFPPEISNGICSLNENEDRLTKTCEMEINSQGKVVDYSIYSSVINSKKAMKYSEVNDLLSGKFVPGYEEFSEDLKTMKELSYILEQAKDKRNYIDFDIPDIKIIHNNFGETIDIKPAFQGLSEKLIENFMVITNETIASNYSWFPFIYRIHEMPDVDSIKEVINILNLSGFKIPKFNNINEKTIKYIFNIISSFDELRIARTEFLKSMKRAKYDTNNIGHFALQLNDYCHFTSPIRRISDFIIHTIIDEIEIFDYSSENIDALQNELQMISENASKAERIDKQMEDEANAMAMAEYMEKHIGEEFEVYITQIYSHGMFAKTKNLISGKIKFEDMLDDKYYFDYDRKAIIGKKTKKKYKLGDKVFVIAKDASKENRTINFQIGKQKSLSLT